jgi:hypothetical protein
MCGNAAARQCGIGNLNSAGDEEYISILNYYIL